MTSEQGNVEKIINSPGTINIVVTVITHVLLLIPAFYIIVVYFIKYSFFSWHPILTVLGVGLLIFEGIFAISGEANLIARVTRANRITIHWILITTGLTLMGIGLIIAVVNKNRLNKYHFSTTHGQLGLSAIVISCVVAGFGIIANNTRWLYPRVRPVLIKVAHALGGITIAIIFIATIINGTYKHSFPGTDVGRDISFACYFFAGLFLLFKPILGAVSRSRVILKPAQTQAA
ncbi:transmembrane reductase CYB561D2 [Microplitis demolitor]|uniref:transmembrane reductase CYB561D2 n=1 Tax=Microplitis demolitor TaxID=69319 RepID=UPI000440006B|nr:transmembrane reductase CYB561D2 [Microplitis demolitor]XP_008552296.1 transmembrane reductase CYB561D2 [Microplitis demolitor]XP_008552299.1 transmembrane reductase CYB561D2 [Microplitis demolitor]XP_008552302.1 transmembrane reductase CYB561D2 [Microplitis demolitor]XP_053594452.1 transmembrane reductase CYB561D2 [Microplitis demolitor]